MHAPLTKLFTISTILLLYFTQGSAQQKARSCDAHCAQEFGNGTGCYHACYRLCMDHGRYAFQGDCNSGLLGYYRMTYLYDDGQMVCQFRRVCNANHCLFETQIPFSCYETISGSRFAIEKGACISVSNNRNRGCLGGTARIRERFRRRGCRSLWYR